MTTPEIYFIFQRPFLYSSPAQLPCVPLPPSLAAITCAPASREFFFCWAIIPRPRVCFATWKRVCFWFVFGLFVLFFCVGRRSLLAVPPHSLRKVAALPLLQARSRNFDACVCGSAVPALIWFVLPFLDSYPFRRKRSRARLVF